MKKQHKYLLAGAAVLVAGIAITMHMKKKAADELAALPPAKPAEQKDELFGNAVSGGGDKRWITRGYDKVNNRTWVEPIAGGRGHFVTGYVRSGVRYDPR